ncbi:MAG: phospholipase D-like domain-containing protein [Candidatus Omnitrophota bacterium]
MKKLLAIFALILTITTNSFASEIWYQARVRDASDRSYEKEVIALLDSAKQSITISMYVIKPHEIKNHPVNLLLNDLLEARGRGVEVNIYLNARFNNVLESGDITRNPIYATLEQKGAKIYFVSSATMLHDKLIIIDERYIVEGSTNWSVAALKNNLESATIIDSPELAKRKLSRISQLPLEGQAKPTTKEEKPIVANLPPEIEIKACLITDKNFFSKMVRNRDEHTIDLYLYLIGLSQAYNSNEFFIDLETIPLDISLPKKWPETAKRRQIIKLLKKLSKNYHLIQVEFYPAKDSWVKLINLPGESFLIPNTYFTEVYINRFSAKAQLLILTDFLLKKEGKSIYSTSLADLSRLLNLNPKIISKALSEVKNYTENQRID